MSDYHEPQQDEELDAEGIPSLQGNPPGMTTSDMVNAVVPPRDHPQGVDEFGITPNEERAQEPLAMRVAREEPEVVPGGTEDGLDLDESTSSELGKVVQPESGVGELDVTKDEVGAAVDDDTALAAEEDAVHLTEPPPMGDGDGYLDED